MRSPKLLRRLPLLAFAVLLAPLRSDGGPCENATTSLQSMINNPVSGDEKFFTLPNGPSNVMLLVDYSESMRTIPQCGDNTGWGDTDAVQCSKWPTFATVGNPTTAGNINGDGTCAVSNDANLKWMLGYKPTSALADPGHGRATFGSVTLVDEPSWGDKCKEAGAPANSCLFDSTKVYGWNDWTETTATPTSVGGDVNNPCTVSVTWTDSHCSGSNVVNDAPQTKYYTLPNCSSCLTDANAAGFYFYKNWKAAYTKKTATRKKVGSTWTCSVATTVEVATGGGSSTVLFSGGWLNANPPKFVTARKVIKDVAWMNPDGTTWATDQLRLGLAFFNYSADSTAIAVPLGPSKADSYPPVQSAYLTARQAILDAVNGNYPASVSSPPHLNYNTPLASALFRVGQYVSSIGTYSSTDWFGSSTWEPDKYKETTKGLINASWVTGTTSSICWDCQKSGIIVITDGSPNTEMTLPTAITGTGTTQTAKFDSAYAAADYKAACGTQATCGSPYSSFNRCCSPSDTAAPSHLPRVAAWLNRHDVSSTYTNPQYVSTSVVSINVPQGTNTIQDNAYRILEATAKLGGGTYNNAADGKALAAALAQAIQQMSTASTSFATPAATALTTINAVDTKAFVTRFRNSGASGKATWEGHLLEWMLFDEAAAGCDPTKKPNPGDESQFITCGGRRVPRNFNKDTDKNGFNVCTGSFLVDKSCYEVFENTDTGVWWAKNDDGSTRAANYFWDAGKVLSDSSMTGYRTAAEPETTGNIAPASKYAPGKTPRNLWTALPDGTMVAFETRNAATLAPYMNLDQAWCIKMEKAAGLCSDPGCPAVAAGLDWQATCAQHVILFTRGWDVVDQDGDGCKGPENSSSLSTNTVITTDATGKLVADTAGSCVRSTVGTTSYKGEERDRANDARGAEAKPAASFYKLGDIFHSSPVLVHPPSSEALCRLGTENQCVRTLFGYTGISKYTNLYQTELAKVPGSDFSDHGYSTCVKPAGEVDAYRAWRNAYAARQNVVLVGSNDGVLHAFDAGGPDTTTGKADADCMMPNVLDGSGEEIWGFLPIDVLPKLKLPMSNTEHIYTVDGNIMVRDVWVDGAQADDNPGNTQSDSGNSADGTKQKNEFRTIVVFGERAGGTQYTALDITNAFVTSGTTPPRPTWKWTFPPPLSDDAQYMGQSWSDFSPRPPPIGAVRLKAETGDHPTGSWIPDPVNHPDDRENFMEKWVVMINGGYDPTVTRGRAVWMLDVWSGSVLWRFTDKDFKTNVMGSASNTTTSMFPIPGAVSMVDIGDPSKGIDSDNFFDTATWGDLGGNLFVARFDVPGRKGTDGKVTNWRAARAFEQGRQSDDSQYATGRSEFFFMPANAFEPQQNRLYTVLGSGNREQILQQGQACGPDNVLSCCRASCSVDNSSKLDYGVCSSTAYFACDATGKMTTTAFDNGCSGGASQCTSNASSKFLGTSSYSLACAAAAKTANGRAECGADGLCTVAELGDDKDITFSGADPCTNKARFYGIWTYGGPVEKVMSTDPATFTGADDWSGAQRFDNNRFTDVANFEKAGACEFLPAQSGHYYCSLVDTTHATVLADGTVQCEHEGDKCQATMYDPGWFYTYNTTCATEAACASGCTNEKTASGAAVLNSCASWNGFIPMGSAEAGSDLCSGAQTQTQTAIGYVSNFITGTPDFVCNQGVNEQYIFRGVKRGTIAPPAAPMIRMGVSQTGRVYYSTLQLDPGSAGASSSLGSRDIASSLYWLEVDRQTHNCRHKGSNCE